MQVELFDPFRVKFDNIKPSNSSSIVMALLASAVLLALVILFVAVLYFRHVSIVGNAGLLFLSIIFVGLLLGYVAMTCAALSLVLH